MFRYPSWAILTFSIACVVGIGSESFGGDRCCAHCGCYQPVTKVCRFVKEEKKVTVTCWGVQEEDFCVNGPSCPGCKHCETICCKDSEGEDKVCAEPKTWSWTHWYPAKGPKLMTKKKLMKKTITKTIPSYKWVVEDLCAQCKQEAKSSDKEAAPKKDEASKK